MVTSYRSMEHCRRLCRMDEYHMLTITLDNFPKNKITSSNLNNCIYSNSNSDRCPGNSNIIDNY